VVAIQALRVRSVEVVADRNEELAARAEEDRASMVLI
jgi:hypothetical protein